MPQHTALISNADAAVPVYLFTTETWSEDADLPNGLAALAKAQAFDGGVGQMVIGATDTGEISGVLFGLGKGTDALGLASLSAKLKAGDYRLANIEDAALAAHAIAWADGAYRFDRYLKTPAEPPRLVVGADESGQAIIREGVAIDRLRDMVNTPAEDMGPPEIQGTISDLAERYGATLETVIGDALLDQNYPMVHAVGRAGPEAPRIMELSWGDTSHPQLAIVGKGVAFDTGGLNLKTGNYMRLMKKDMGGSACVLALAMMIMDAGLDVRLRVLVPAVENSISAGAFRPGDILPSRNGMTVEIGNTDAEGR